MNKNSQVIVSVVTIVYNEVNEIEKTIESIINQDFKNFELIVIDGGSNDGTQTLIEKYKDKITYFLSEKDSGIYDAMNKGLKVCNGSWVNFMNAGDKFYNHSVLSNVFNKNTSLEQFSLVYGYKYVNGVKTLPKELEVLKKGDIMANHQSMFFNRVKIGKELIYSLKYPIYGDYELVNRIYMVFGKESFFYHDSAIAIYAGGGISSVVSWQKRKDKFKIIFRTYGIAGVIKSLIYSKFNVRKFRNYIKKQL